MLPEAPSAANKPVAVLIILVHSTCNAGDLALLEVTVRQAARAFHPARITVSTNYPDEAYYRAHPEFVTVPSPRHIIGIEQGQPVLEGVLKLAQGAAAALAYRGGLRLACPAPWKALFAAYQQADVVIGVAGNQFYSTGRYGWPLPVSAFAVELAHLFGKPFYTMPQSIGPFKRGWEHAILRHIYGKARGLFFREPISVQLAHHVGIPPEKIHAAPDPAFDFPVASPQEAAPWISRYHLDQTAPKIGATLIAPMGRSLDAGEVARYYQAMAALFTHLIETFGAQIYLFNQVVGPSALEDDRAAARQVIAAMGEAARRVVWVDEILAPQLLKTCYGRMNFFIASRLHSGIFAMSQGVPALLIGYLTKTRGILSAVGLEDWVIDLGEIQAERLIAMASQAWLEREARSALLAERMPAMIAKAGSAMEWIAKDYAHNAHPDSSDR